MAAFDIMETGAVLDGPMVAGIRNPDSYQEPVAVGMSRRQILRIVATKDMTGVSTIARNVRLTATVVSENVTAN
jgi:hypothetical protein